MGVYGIGPGSLILILLIVIVLFGSKRIRSLGQDLAGVIKSFRSAMQEDKPHKDEQQPKDDQ